MVTHTQLLFSALAFLVLRTEAGQIDGVVVGPAGVPLAKAWVMTCSGQVTQTRADGSFALNGLRHGGYALKAVAAGMDDAWQTQVAVTSDVPVTCRLQMTPAGQARAIVSGQATDAATGKRVPAWFEIRDSAGPVRWFDVAGRPYGGRTDVPPAVWHQKNKRFWTSGKFAFSARPGELQLTARADGYASVTVRRVLAPSAQENLEIALQPLFDPADEGWFKGDFHAHGAHGENLYTVNIPFMAFLLRAESYRWFYIASSFNNDGVTVDSERIAAQENDPDLFLALNSEYPKTFGGHVGNLGIAPAKRPLPYPRFSNTEVIKRDIADQGGAAIPVHPLTGHMKSRELPFLIIGAPELICGFDFYTSWSERLEKTWALFLNQGYRLCRTATSDTAFDLGRTPGTMGATYIHPQGGALSRAAIVDAFKKGQTSIAWDGALLLFAIDGTVCGSQFPADGTARKARLTLYDAPGRKAQIAVARNGETCRRFPVTVPACGKAEVTFTLAEREKAWYTAVCAIDGKPSNVIGATSPFYFGTWTPPSPVMAQIDVTVFDADTKEPLDAAIRLTDSGKAVAEQQATGGRLHLVARTFQRLTASAQGYADQEAGILGTEAISAFIASVSEDDLQDWHTYEKARALLQTVKIAFPMKRKSNTAR